MYVVFFYIVVCLGLAIWPQSGRIKLGMPDERPEFSRFSWFSMMFGAGIGIGMLTFATAEPIYHFGNNPDVIQGFATAESPGNVRPPPINGPSCTGDFRLGPVTRSSVSRWRFSATRVVCH